MPRDRLRRVENYLHKLFDSAAWHRHLSILLSNLARERVVSLPRGARRSGKATTGAESFGWCERERGKKDRVRAESNRSWAIPKRNSRESHSDLRHRGRLSTSSIRLLLEIPRFLNFGVESPVSIIKTAKSVEIEMIGNVLSRKLKNFKSSERVKKKFHLRKVETPN